MRKTWLFLVGLAVASAVLAQNQPPGPGDGDPKAPDRKAAVKKAPEPPAPRTGPGQAGSPDAKNPPADPQKQAK